MKTLEELHLISRTPWQERGRDFSVADKDGELVCDFCSPNAARLIAAAPDLYEALRLAYAEAVGEARIVPKRGWVVQARKALKKASEATEGELQ